MNRKKNEKKNEKKFNYATTIIPIIISAISLVISIITVYITIKEDRKNELIMRPRFSLEKNTEGDEEGQFIWKISNLGGAISNATIYPVMHISFLFYNKEKKEDIDINLEMFGYYNDNYYYRNSDGSFYVKDDKESELDCFIENYINLIRLDGVVNTGYSINPCFVLHYDDYKGKTCNKTYTIVNDDLIEDGSGHNLLNNMKQLKEISKLPSVDIEASLEKDAGIITVYYKNAETKKITNNEKEYNDYLHSVILDLVDSKDKHVKKMFGDVILAYGNLWRRDANTGVLICVAQNVKEIGYNKNLELTGVTNDGKPFITK